MSKDSKFGTFGGVFTPSILTILGVIMYLRLPWVIGEVGLMLGLGIIAVAHVISWTTGLSISSIATDKKVGAGGPYYIVSRSLGLPIGGTLGLALFVGLSFSISLYIIGFCESFLAVADIEPTPTNIRLAGTVVMLVLTGVTLVSTAFAIKTQYIILALIGVSLVSIAFGGSSPAPESIHTQAPADGADLGTVFGIFFPAVTGFTAGVNMSGDLKDPKRSIPAGTIAAIGTGMLVYVGLAVFIAARVDVSSMRNSTDILSAIALFPPAVVAGIWGATLSSALGSILGAPRILQALGGDRVVPRFFAKGHGKTNEPRNALLLAFALGEAGVLIAELDAIARIVSMVFLTTYGFLNLSCTAERLASPDFRPSFKIPLLVSIVGAGTCALVMIQLDFAAMAGATALMAGLFVWLQRRQLTLDSGDTWEGIWSSIVRAGLHRLNQERGQRRNWRPNVLLFSHGGGRTRPRLLELAKALITGNGLLTDFELVDPKQAANEVEETESAQVGVFRRRTACEDYYETVTGACRHHGFTGLDPNTVLLDWDNERNEPQRYVDLLKSTAAQDFNVIALHYDEERGWGERKRVDVWWRPQQGNVALSLAILRFITRFESWQDVKLRFLLISEDPTLSDDLSTTMRGLLADARIDAAVKIVATPSQAHGFENSVRQESADADLVVLGMPNLARLDPRRLARTNELVDSLGSVMLVHGSSLFAEVLPVGGRGMTEAIERAQLSATELRPLKFPEPPELEEPCAAFAEALGKQTQSLHTKALAPVLARHEGLVAEIRDLVDRHFDILRKGIESADPARARKPAGRAQGGFLFQARKRLEDFEKDILPTQAKTLQHRLEEMIEQTKALTKGVPKSVRVVGKAVDFEPSEDDSPYLRRFKRSRRRWAKVRRRPPVYYVPMARLIHHAVHAQAVPMLEQSVRSAAASSHRLAVQLGKLLSGVGYELSTVAGEIDRREATAQSIESRKQRILDNLEAAAQLARELSEGIGNKLARTTWEISQGLANDLKRIDVARIAFKDHKTPKNAMQRLTGIGDAAEQWSEHQTLLLHRAQLGLQIAAFQHRLSTLVSRTRSDVMLQIRDSVLGDGTELLQKLRSFGSEVAEGKTPKFGFDRELRARFDSQTAVDSLARDVNGCLEDLPESITTLSDEAIASLESGATAEVEHVTVSVRRLVQFLIETEFLDVVSQELTGIPLQEQRAVGVAHDVTRLLAFTLGDLDAMGGWNNDAFRDQILSVVRDGTNRLDREVSALRDTVDGFGERVDKQLESLRTETDPYALTGRSDSLGQYIRSRESQKAVSRIRQLAQRVATLARTTFVALLYRRSTGVLLARRLGRADDGTGARPADHVTGLARSSQPRKGLLASLPFYYRQLFSGQSTISETFWVGREAELERARSAVRHHEHGGHGAIFVVGETGAGKTSLCHVIAAKCLQRRRVVRVVPPPGGTTDVTAMRRAIEAELKERGEIDTLMRKLPDGVVFLFDDLELWWERSEDGNRLINTFVELVEKYGDRHLFIANINVHAWRFIGGLTRIGDVALAVIDCEPLPAETLKSIISLRHGSTGLSFVLGNTREEELAPWRQARLFTRYFDYSGGLVAAALRAWLSHIEKVDGNTLVMRWPKRPRVSVLDGLRIEMSALLLQLVLHKQVTLGRLCRITGQGEDALEADLGPLVRMGLVRRDSRDILHVDRYAAHWVTDRLRAQGMVA